MLDRDHARRPFVNSVALFLFGDRWANELPSNPESPGLGFESVGRASSRAVTRSLDRHLHLSMARPYHRATLSTPIPSDDEFLTTIQQILVDHYVKNFASYKKRYGAQLG